MRPSITTTFVDRSWQEGPGVGNTLIAIRRARSGIGAEFEIQWDQLPEIMGNKQQVYLLLGALRSLANELGRRHLKPFGCNHLKRIEEGTIE